MEKLLNKLPEEAAPYITIGIASYNYAEFLPRAFDAIKKQTFTDFEILYSDDGSEDSSVKVIENIIEQNPALKIRLISHPQNQGLLANKNCILDHARGKYLMICDADDYMDTRCLELLAKEAERTNAEHIIGSVADLDKRGEMIHIRKVSEKTSKWMQTLHHGCIYRMDFLRKYNIRFTQFPDDNCFIKLVNYYSKNVRYVESVVYYWCFHENSTGSSLKKELLWRNVLKQVSQISSQLTSQKEKKELYCYLYKMYYMFLLEPPVSKQKNFKITQYKNQKRELKAIFPHYLRDLLLNSIVLKDTKVKMQLLGCGLGDFLGVIKLYMYYLDRH